MNPRKASAVWKGTLKEGNGKLQLTTISQELPYSFSSRFENGPGSNPEELIAAAHAGCFSMAFSLELTENGFEPRSISTTAEVSLAKKEGGGFKISESRLSTEADVPGISNDLFQKLAESAKTNCPVSQALSALKISVQAQLIS